MDNKRWQRQECRLKSKSSWMILRLETSERRITLNPQSWWRSKDEAKCGWFSADICIYVVSYLFISSYLIDVSCSAAEAADVTAGSLCLTVPPVWLQFPSSRAILLDATLPLSDPTFRVRHTKLLLSAVFPRLWPTIGQKHSDQRRCLDLTLISQNKASEQHDISVSLRMNWFVGKIWLKKSCQW